MNHKKGFIPYTGKTYTTDKLKEKSHEFYEFMEKRRTVRDFSDKEVPKEVIKNILMSASSAPSGAHKQPWTFCAISNAQLKSVIREAAEKEEYENYHGRMSDEWLDDLSPFDTDWNKPFIDIAPWLIIIFRKAYDMEDGKKRKNYYVQESVGIATGFLLNAIHHAGLVALTHTPSPMNFLGKILERPENEKPYLLIPVGYPMENAEVPILERKKEEDVIVWY
ncbi:MAG: iodotyrosine deiodinase [Maribacter sp.]|jgi:iodotyrosine deiodinase